MIFFAGHGKFDDTFNQGYLVAADSKIDDPTGRTMLPHSVIHGIVDAIPSEHILLIMDACFSGAFDRTLSQALRGPFRNDPSNREFIRRKKQFRTRQYITSGGEEYVADGRPGENSPFVNAMLRALRTYGGEDGILTIGELLVGLERVVPMPRNNEFGGNEAGSDFLFIAK